MKKLHYKLIPSLVAMVSVMLFVNVALAQFGHVPVAMFKVVGDTTVINKSVGRAYHYTADHLYYVGAGTYLKQVATEGDSISLSTISVDTLYGRSTDSIFVKDDLIMLRDILFSGTASNLSYWVDSGGDTVLVIDPNASGGASLYMMDGSGVDTVRFYHDGVNFYIVPDAGTGKIDIDGTAEADSLRSEDGNFVFSPTTDKTTILTGVVNDSLRVEETVLVKGITTLNNRANINVSGSTIGLSIDGNKTSGNLAQFINDNNGAVGDSSVALNSTGYLGIGITPTSRLHVNGSANILGDISGDDLTVGYGGGSAEISTANSGQNLTITPNNANTIVSTGSLGIGTTAPGALLTVNSKSDTLLQIFGDKDGQRWSSADSTGLLVLPTGNVEIGNAIDQRTPSFSLKGDADSDASAVTSETFTCELTANATPTNAYWNITSTQGAFRFGGVYLNVATESTTFPRGLFSSQHNNAAGTATIGFKKSRGSEAAPSTVVANENLGSFWMYVYDGTNYLRTASLGFQTVGTVTTGSVPTDMLFSTAAADYSSITSNERMRIKSSGEIGIGTTAPLSSSLTLGTKATQRDFLLTRENVPAGTDSSLYGTITSGVPVWRFNGSDGDQFQWSINTSDEAILQNAAGLTLDTGTALKLGTLQWDVVGTDSINGAQIAAGTVAATSLALAKDLVSGNGLDGGVDNILPGTDSDVTLNVLVDNDGGLEIADDSLNIKLNGATLTLGTSGLSVTNDPDLRVLKTDFGDSLVNYDGNGLVVLDNNAVNVLVDYDGGLEIADDSLNIKINGSELVTTSAGLAIAGTIDLDSLTTAKIRRASSPLTLDVTGSGNSYVEIIQDNYAGMLAVGRTTGTEYSMITVCDGGADNHPGFWQMLSDDGNGNYHWHSTDHVYRVAASLPADDDAGGYAIIDADDGTIGASTQNVNANNVVAANNVRIADSLIVTGGGGADSLRVYDDGDTTRLVSDNPIKLGTGSLIVPTSGAVTVNGNLTVTGRVEQQIPDHLFCAAEDSSTLISISQDSIWYQVTGASDTLFKFLEKDGFSAYDDTIQYTGTNNAHIEFLYSISGTGTNAKDFEVRIFNVTDNAEVYRKIKFTTTGATNFAGYSGIAYDINANTNDEYVMQIRCVTDDSDFTFYGGHILAKVVHY